MTNNEATNLFHQIRDLILSARNIASRNVDTIQVLTNVEVGRRIVEHEQQGAKRARYGKRVLRELSEKLVDEFGKGFSLTNLKLMRQFYLSNKERIGQTPSGELPPSPIGQTLSDQRKSGSPTFAFNARMRAYPSSSSNGAEPERKNPAASSRAEHGAKCRRPSI